MSKRTKGKRPSKTDSTLSNDTVELSELTKQASAWDPNREDKSDPAPGDNADTESAAKLPGAVVSEQEVEEEENSPYEEVRIAVPNTDDENLPVSTIRAWVIGLTLGVIGAAVNTLFSLRHPVIGIGVIIAQLVAWVLGNAWAKWVPSKERETFGIKWNLNPGPFNVKEHTIMVIMSGDCYHTAYATDIIIAQKVFYKQDFGLVFQILLVITTQCIGFGIAGLLRRFLVYPAAMIWPLNLVASTLLHAMHKKEEDLDPTVFGGNMSTYKWFGLVFMASFCYYWIPGFLAQFLSLTVFMTWIFPQNPVVNQVFGGFTGLGLLPITFDWTIVTGFTGNPMIPPFHAIANTMVGVIVFSIIGNLIFHFSGTWYAEYLPMNNPTTYDNTGQKYNISRVLTPHFTLDEAAYKEYSPLFLSTSFAIRYGLSFATISSVIIYTYLNYRHIIAAQLKNPNSEPDDIHRKLMRKYAEVPDWWYAVFFVLLLGLSLVTVLAYDTEFTWWAFLIAIAFAMVMALPVGIIAAVTNMHIGLNVITEFIMGYMQPGKPLALMMFKTYGFIAAQNGLGFVQALKIAQYMKIPPRIMFTVQIVATTVAGLVQIAVLNFALDNIEDVCEITQKQRFSCPGGRVFYSSSVIWGLIGPSRVFSPGSIHAGLLLFFPLGVVVTIILHYLAKTKRLRGLRYAMTPVIFSGGSNIPPASPLNYLTWGFVGWLFQYYVKRRHGRWWARLNYLTAIGLDVGLALATLMIFLIFTLNKIDPPKWWGNTVSKGTMDVLDTAVQRRVPEGATFGPRIW
ncbi:OPT family small oligopeptide transporter [Dendryphion nanum]|uniref:OPT family small oligopeptide transporter n=1 Tax=Dendryphion nanum TaxID=256645 RepID=A0A9P9DU26_9PLEO|nr:OPT family small oligopeptide transporter [Dendryphion nanum]